jgi:serine/threonine-protein kinase
MAGGNPYGEYLLMRRLGKGGMAEVFLAKRIRAKGFEKLLVVKRLLPHLCRDERASAMFLNEARIAALIDHPNLAHVSDFGEVHGSYYLAMEYVQGTSLADVLEAEGSMSVPVAVRIAIELLEALHAIHEAKGPDGEPLGLVHRDVSPRNVMIRADGVVKLLDLGIVASSGAGDLRVMGTRGYMSPEQMRGEKLDARSDLYSIGMLLIRMITAKSPTSTEMPTASPRPTMIPVELWSILERVLSPDPDRRPATALVLHNLLEAFVSRFGVESSRVHVGAFVARAQKKTTFGQRVATGIARITRLTRIEPMDESAPVPATGREKAIGFSVLLVVALAAGFTLTVWRMRSAEAPGRPAPAPIADEAPIAPPVVLSAGSTIADDVRPPPVDEPSRRPPAKKREAQPGFLTIDTEPWTEVYLGGKKLGITPLEAVRLPRGAHELELRNSEFGLRRRVRVVIHPGAVTRLHKRF